MRIFRVLLGYKHPGSKSRPQQDPNKVPFKSILPLELRNRVSGKIDAQGQVPCLHELSVIFASMKDNEFNEKNCEREFQALDKAHVQAMNQARIDKLKNAGQLLTTGNKLNSKQLNKYLKKFPNL